MINPTTQRYIYLRFLLMLVIVKRFNDLLAQTDAPEENTAYDAKTTINEPEGYVTNVNSNLVQTALADYNTRLESDINTNLPNATAGDILGKKEIIQKQQQILPASLPYKVIVTGSQNSEIPDQYRQKVTIQLGDAYDTAFTYPTSLPQIAGKRVTVSSDPATQAEQDIINRYAQDYATSIPAYLVNLKPVLKIEGATVATGPSIGMGNPQDLNVSIPSPTGTEMVSHKLFAGSYSAIGINSSKISLEALQKRIGKNDFSEPVGEMLHQIALSYWAEADAFNDVTAKTLRVNTIRHPSELAATAKITIAYLYGAPSSATYKSRNLDVKFDHQSVISKVGDKTKEISYMQQSGANSSFLEGAVFDQLFGKGIGDSISAMTALKAANDQGIPIYRIDSTNISTTLSKLQVSDAIKSEISNSVNAGLTVQISQTNIAQAGWAGVGYIVLNPTDGSGAYRISGGMNGGDSGAGSNTIIPLPQVPLTGPTALIIGGLTSNVGTLVTTEAGVLVGIAIPAPQVLAMAMLIFIIFEMVKEIAKKYPPPPPVWEKYRHYTTYTSLTLILLTRYIASSFTGDLGPGAYVTDILDKNP